MSMQGRVARPAKKAFEKAQAMKPKPVVRYRGTGFGAYPIDEKRERRFSAMEQIETRLMMMDFPEVCMFARKGEGMAELLDRLEDGRHYAIDSDFFNLK